MENQGSNPNGGDGRDESPLALRRNETGQALVPAQPQHALIESRPREMEADGDEIDLRNYLRIFLRRKWWIVSAALVGFALAGFITLLQTPIYRAIATIQIQDRADQVVNVGAINQPSAQWTITQLFMKLRADMTPSQQQRSLEIVKRNIETQSDWIVLNTAIEALAAWSHKNSPLAQWLVPHLERLSMDGRKSVATRARKALAARPMP